MPPDAQARTDLLHKEAERQKHIDDLKRQFADKANNLARWLGEVRAKITEDRATLEEQLTVVRMKQAELEKKAPEVRVALRRARRGRWPRR